MKMSAIDVVKGLSLWKSAVEPVAVKGGITNANFMVEDEGKRYFVRVGADIPVHGVMRFNEAAASRAAAQCGLSPALLHVAPGALVFDFLSARTLDAASVRSPEMLERALELVCKCHREMQRLVRGPALVFWVFHVLRDYAHSLREANSRHVEALGALMRSADQLERAVGAVDLVYAHNDLLPTNLMDDGTRLWLIDWDYAGFNSPLFDLSNLASNNEVDEAGERRLLEGYFDRQVEDELWRRYSAMKCASLLRETMWSMVSEIHSDLDFDYTAYTAENRARFERALRQFQDL
jgi:thiamine kinase-like enzyme